jgi:hypothetical protein
MSGDPRRGSSRHATMLLRAAIAGAVLVAFAPAAADAAWLTSGRGGASVAGGTVGAAAAPTADVSADVVSLSWTPVQLLGGLLVTDRATVVGFRQDGETESGPFDLDPSCTDTAATACTHTQPIGETWRYAVIASLGAWTGPQGAKGAAATVAPPPTSLVTFPGGGPVSAAGWDAACTQGAGVCGSATPTTGGAAITRVEVRLTDPDGRSLDASGEWVESEVWRTALDRTPAAAGEPSTVDWHLPVAASVLAGRPDGTYAVAVRAGDAARWDAVAGTSGSVVVDRIAPVTTSDAPTGVQPSATTVTFSATDTGGSGVATTEYRTSTDGGSSFTAWTTGTSVTLGTSATHTLEFRSTDAAGNVESPRTATVVVDLTAPSVTLTAPSDATTVLSRTAVTLSATASHPNFSIGSVQFAWSRDGSTWTAIGDPVTTPVAGVYSVTTTSPHLPAGVLQLRATAVRTGDVIGVSATRSITVRPEIVSLALENASTAGTAEEGDRVVITFTDALDPASVCSTFSSSSGSQSHSDLTVQITGNPNVLTITNAGGCGISGFGSLTLSRGGNRYTNLTLTFTGSTITWDADARQLRLTLGARTGTERTGATAHDTTFTPGALTAEGVGLPAGTFTATGQRF